VNRQSGVGIPNIWFPETPTYSYRSRDTAHAQYQSHYQNGLCRQLLPFTGHAINIEARNLVGWINGCNSTKINTLASKGAWSGSRDLLFKFCDLSVMGEARHFVFSLLDRSYYTADDE